VQWCWIEGFTRDEMHFCGNAAAWSSAARLSARGGILVSGEAFDQQLHAIGVFLSPFHIIPKP